MDIQDLDKQYALQVYKRQPILVRSGKGCYLIDVSGKEFLDFSAGIAVNIFGHCDPKLVHVAQAQLQQLWHTSNLYYIDKQIICAQKLIQKSFPGQVFFTNSGTESNECAIKLARAYGYINNIQSPEIISLRDSFHGRTCGSLSITGQKKYQEKFGALVPHVKFGIMNDIHSIQKLISSSTVAIIVEPIQGEGGLIPSDIGFLSKIRELCFKHDILLIFDEVQTGMGRIGYCFAYQYYDVVPDVITCGKGIGGGFPVGAVIVDHKYSSVLSFGDHGSTFGGNPVACSVVSEVLSRLTPDFLSSVRAKGEFLKDQLDCIRTQYTDIIVDIRGIGLMLGMELHPSIPTDLFIQKSYSKELLLTSVGHNTIRFSPPLIVSQADIKRCLDIVMSVLEDIRGNL